MIGPGSGGNTLAGNSSCQEPVVANHLRPVRHPQGDLFIADVLDAAPRDDMAGMEHPMFALKAGDTRERRYEHRGAVVELVPSVRGLATVHDKDVLIYCISQLMAKKNAGQEIGRTIRLIAYDLLVTTNRPTNGDAYDRLEAALDRLDGTRLRTNIKTGGQRERQGFGLLSDYQIVEYDNRERMAWIEVELPRWLYRAVESNEVLSISRDYFRIRKPLDRRIYELARKHCGYQQRWRVSLEVLHRKTGSTQPRNKFRADIRSLATSGELPDYRLTYERDKDLVTVYPRGGHGALAQAEDMINAGGNRTWDLFDR